VAVVGDRAYFIGRDSWGASYQDSSSPSHDTQADLYVTDGTASGTMLVSSVFEGPVIAGGKAVYSSAFDDAALREANASTGTIIGTVGRSDVPANDAGNDASFKEGGLRVFLDLDRDGKRDSNEPVAITDISGKYVLTGIKPSSKPYAVAIERFGKWSAKDGWSQETRVRAGHMVTRQFRFEDHKRSSVVTGTLVHGKDKTPSGNKRIELRGESVESGGVFVGTFTTDSDGHFRIEGLSAGSYSLDLGTSHLTSGNGYWFTIGIGQTLSL
jgi:hypothetical protein